VKSTHFPQQESSSTSYIHGNDSILSEIETKVDFLHSKTDRWRDHLSVVRREKVFPDHDGQTARQIDLSRRQQTAPVKPGRPFRVNPASILIMGVTILDGERISFGSR